ncbi:8217_t:CDS:2 [Funneliformis mosseae]|uniref:8217_t:CDS:1 n=1 Tax=Funneliformis mosseae TaxID=27381 RepID=A0A9N8V8C1_FUNMO|nr:8217_t:CDS:2 [Funneliformis mosseae]
MDKITIKELNFMFKICQKQKFDDQIPEDIVQIIREYIVSKKLVVHLRETISRRKKKYYEFGWDQDDLLTQLVSLSAKLFKPQVENLKSTHIKTMNKWFLDPKKHNMKFEVELNSRAEVMTEIILNQERYLPGFKYFYEYDWGYSDEKDDVSLEGDLLFISEVGIMAVVEVKHINKAHLKENKKEIKRQAKKFKYFADKRFGSRVVAIIGLYAIHGKDGQIALDYIDPFDKRLAKKARAFLEKESSASSDSSSDDETDSALDDALQSDQGNNSFKLFKSTIKFIFEIPYRMDVTEESASL